MATKNFSLKDIQLLADQYSQSGNPETVALFQAIQSIYKPGQNPADRPPIDPLEIIKVLEKTTQLLPENPDQHLDWLSSTREKLNRELFDTISKQNNPAELIVGPDYTFIQVLENPQPTSTKPVEATAQTRKFKESEITFNLPDELKQEFEQQLERLKEKEEQTNIQMREILAKEKQLEENKVRLEQENAEFRIRLQKLREEEQKYNDQSKEQSEKETARFRQELEETRKELETLRNERSNLLTEHETSRARLDTDFSRRDQIFRAKFDEMTELMEKQFTEEKALQQRKEKDYKASKSKQLQIKKVSQQQAKQNQQLLKLSKSLETEKKSFKLRLKKEFDKRKDELEREYQRRSEYHIRRLEEFDEDEERLGRENERLRIREQGLALEAQRKADEQTKKRLADLEKLEKELTRKQKNLNKQEKESDVEKASLLKEMSGIQDGKFAVDQIKTAAKTQASILKRKKKLLKEMEADRPKIEQEIQKKTQALEDEYEKETQKVAEKIKSVLEEQKRLRNKETLLLERETEELKTMNDEFEEFKNSLEVEQIEKDMALDEKEEKLDKEEQKILALQQQQMAEEKETREKLSEAEAEVMQELQGIQAIKSDVAQHQEEVKNFLSDFHTTYNDILSTQSSDYDAFKSRIASMEEEAVRLTSNLKEKEKSITEDTIAAERELQERLKHKESLVDTMESDLRKRVEEYQGFVKELTDVKQSMNEEDVARKAELMDSLSQYENKLTSLGKAFEELSEAFQTEKEKGQVEIVPEEDDKKPLEYDDALAKAEWPLAIRTRLGLVTSSENSPHINDYLYKFSEKWDEWIRVPQGKLLMGHPNSKDSAPHKQVEIEKPFLIKKYPVTNVEFFRFVNETNYKTEAETLVDAIVYQSGSLALQGAGSHSTQSSFSNPSLGPVKDAFWLCPDGQADSLNGKHNHPVTQVTWNDAQAYCKWKSELTGQNIRLPSEKEWEFVASDFGKTSPDHFYWDEDRIVEFCNIEETGILATLPVDHFPENEYSGGIRDLFGNVFEWVQDKHEKKSSNGSSNSLEYKIARGGSFITHFKHIAAWRRISFIKTYCTSFLGFRTVCDDT
jgi:formylglycine-generating enzyme